MLRSRGWGKIMSSTKRISIGALLALALLLAVAGWASSPPDILYVSPAGNDAADGSKNSPLRTIGMALSKATAPMEIYVAAGVYPSGTVTLKPGVSISGGYGGNNWQQKPEYVSEILVSS